MSETRQLMMLALVYMFLIGACYANELHVAPVESSTYKIEPLTKTQIPETLGGCKLEKMGHLSFYIDNPIVSRLATKGTGMIVFGGVGLYSDCPNAKQQSKWVLIPTIQWYPIYGDILKSLMFSWHDHHTGNPFVTDTEKIWIAKMFTSLNTNIRPKDTKFIKYVGDKLYFEWDKQTFKIFLNKHWRYAQNIPEGEFGRTYNKFMAVGFKETHAI